MPVILLNMENLYESLYDALNQVGYNKIMVCLMVNLLLVLFKSRLNVSLT